MFSSLRQVVMLLRRAQEPEEPYTAPIFEAHLGNISANAVAGTYFVGSLGGLSIKHKNLMLLSKWFSNVKIGFCIVVISEVKAGKRFTKAVWNANQVLEQPGGIQCVVLANWMNFLGRS